MLYLFVSSFVCFLDNCRMIVFLEAMADATLQHHMIQTVVPSASEHSCSILCYLHDDCVSYNYGQELCQLNNSTAAEHPLDLKQKPNFIYRGIKVNEEFIMIVSPLRLSFSTNMHNMLFAGIEVRLGKQLWLGPYSWEERPENTLFYLFIFACLFVCLFLLLLFQLFLIQRPIGYTLPLKQPSATLCVHSV